MGLKPFSYEVGKMQLLKQKRLWQSYNTNKDKKTKDDLIEVYLPLVKYVVNRLIISLPPYLDYQDLISFGVFGLIQAIERYDPSRGIKFETYAYTRIRGSIIDEIKRMDWIPNSVRKKAKILQNAYEVLEQTLGRTITDDDICKHLNISLKELEELYRETSFLHIMPLDEISDKEYLSLANNDPEKVLEKNEIKKILANSIEKLRPEEKLVITLYYYEGLTLKEISQVMNLSQARISQIHTKAILRIRGSLSKKRAIFR